MWILSDFSLSFLRRNYKIANEVSVISLIHAYLENRETFMENFIDQEEGFKKVEKPIWK